MGVRARTESQSCGMRGLHTTGRCQSHCGPVPQRPEGRKKTYTRGLDNRGNIERISFFPIPYFARPAWGGDGSRGAEEGEKPTGFGCQNVIQTYVMALTRQRVDKDTFKQIFRDHWEPFQQHQPRYQDRHVQAVIDNMLGCGTVEAGSTTYLCPHCLAEKRLAFSCKSSFCLSCGKVYVDEWVAHIGRTLYEGVAYRHVVLTMPEALHLEFYRDRPL